MSIAEEVQLVELRHHLQTAILDLLALADTVEILLNHRMPSKGERDFAQRRLDRMRGRYSWDPRNGPRITRTLNDG